MVSSSVGTALHVACEAYATECALYLIQKGARTSIKNEEKITPVYLAARHTNFRIMDALLGRHSSEHAQLLLWLTQRGHDIRPIRHLLKSTHCHVSSGVIDEAMRNLCQNTQNTAPIIELLTKYGGSIESKDRQGNGLLHIACQNSNLPVCEMLVRLGCTPDEINAAGETPLMTACTNRRVKLELLELLMTAGAHKHQKSVFQYQTNQVLAGYKNTEKAEQIRAIIYK